MVFKIVCILQKKGRRKLQSTVYTLYALNKSKAKDCSFQFQSVFSNTNELNIVISFFVTCLQLIYNLIAVHHHFKTNGNSYIRRIKLSNSSLN